MCHIIRPTIPVEHMTFEEREAEHVWRILEAVQTLFAEKAAALAKQMGERFRPMEEAAEAIRLAIDMELRRRKKAIDSEA